jgi:glycosyltransferase involved in cell wall biosynthesis
VERSLTVLIPVHNAQSTLAGTVAEILEIVADLTERFELVIVDDGSSDATSETAQDLTSRYPQVRALRHGRRLGRDAAICTGLNNSTGEIIFLRDEVAGVAVDSLARLWRSEQRRQGSTRPDSASQGDRWTRFSGGHAIGRGGYRMVDRETLERRHRSSRPAGPNYMTKLREFALGE